MKLYLIQTKRASERGSALMMVAMVMAVSAIILTGAMQWASSNSRMNARNNEYYQTVASAEAATEKIVSMMSKDFRDNDWAYVDNRLPTYRTSVPLPSESSMWNDVVFWDPAGSSNGIYVARRSTAQFMELDSQYSGLRGYAATYTVVANAQRESNVGAPMTAGVRQQFQLATIPIFQYAIFYGVLMELHPGPTFTVTGRVHANDALYYSSGNGLSFNSDVTSVGDLRNAWAPGDTHHSGTPGNSVTFRGEADQHVSTLQLPIGTNNTAAAVREILQPAPSTAVESPASAMGMQRFHNKANMVITVTNGAVTVTSGRHNNFATVVPTNQWSSFINTTRSFTDAREAKIVRPVDIDVAALRAWNATNSILRSVIPDNDVSSIYVNDQRTLPSTEMGAVRVRNGAELPPDGLTVATARPLYVQGNYNQPTSGYLGTTNTTTSKPASFAADAINVLSGNWSDLLSAGSMALRLPSDTTVNAAFLAGIVPTLESNRTSAQGGKYSGGVENYPRFLENWSGRTFTYNGSMVVLFNSRYATNGWQYGGNIYNAPNRRWAFDLNFMDPTKLPPGTPQLTAMIRGSWAVVPAGNTNTVDETTVVTVGGGGTGGQSNY